MSEEKYMVSQTIKYSDGTETTMNYDANENQAEIETTVAEATAITSPELEVETPEEEVAEETVEEAVA